MGRKCLGSGSSGRIRSLDFRITSEVFFLERKREGEKERDRERERVRKKETEKERG